MAQQCSGRGGNNATNNDAVTLIVGSEREHFTVPESLLLDKVPFFLNAFQGRFVEFKTKTFTFPDDEPEDFQNLIKWLGEGSIQAVSFDPSWLWLSRVWTFANKYSVDALGNEVIDTLHAKFAAHRSGINISFDTLDYVVENTTARSPLRRLFVDMLTNGISLVQLLTRVESIPPELLQDMVVALKQTVYLNNPHATSLLTSPIDSYYTTSAHCKATAMPKASPNSQASPFHCEDGAHCDGAPMTEAMYICTHHQIKFCEACGPYHRGHRLKLISLTTPAYKSAVTGPDVTVIDGHINDSGFYCDGPSCDPGQHGSTHTKHALMSGDRYHCLECRNKDFCTLCVRGQLSCKVERHSMLRIRPTFAKRNVLGEVGIAERQRREREGVCWRCGGQGHEAEACEEKVMAEIGDIEVEE